MRLPRLRPLIAVLLTTGLLPASVVRAADTWAVPHATIRFLVRPQFQPVHSESGYIVRLPDGGILPEGNPHLQVVRKDGTPIEAYLLWHNALSGVTLVCADPGSREDFYVYAGGKEGISRWTPQKPLKPGPLLCTDPNGSTLADAERLAGSASVGPTVHNASIAGIPVAPLCIGGDQTGRPSPAAYYLLAHVVTTDPGKTWIAPFTLSGQNKVLVNGKALTKRQRIDKWGGRGDYFNLGKGLHRIEVYATEPAVPSGEEPKGVMYLTWRTPNASMAELGGVRGDDVPMTGTSKQETRVLRPNEIAESGQSRVLRAETKTGLPLPVIQAKPIQNFWFKGTTPQIVYQFSALTEGHPEDTRYLWRFGQGAQLEGKDCSWLTPGRTEQQVTLHLASGNHKAQATLPFYAYTTIKTSMNDERARRDYREACLDMLKAHPKGQDPTSSWTASQWETLFGTMDFGKGYYLFDHLFNHCWSQQNPKISPARLHALQDAFLDVAPRKDPLEAIALSRRFQQQSGGDPQRRAMLMVREADIGMFYMGKTNEVAQLLIAASRIGGEAAERARIRMGDLALIRDDLNAATEHYAAVQNRAKELRNKAAAAGNWRVGALLDTAAAERAKTQIHQGYLLEAAETLRQWERNFPLSKITGDFILLEAQLHMAAENYRRARPMLEAYCRSIDASSHLPEAATALIECLEALRVPRAERDAVKKDLGERLKFHPVGEEFLESLKPGGELKPMKGVDR